MQYKVPQNVDIADKVIGGLTLRQFMFLLISGALILISKYIFIGGIRFLFFPFAIVVGLMGIALAFIKINDRPFEFFLISAAKTFLRPSKRVWHKEEYEEEKVVNKKSAIEQPHPKKSLDEQRSNLKTLAALIDTGGSFNKADRITNLKPRDNADPSGLNDVIAKTEQPSAKIEQILDDAKNVVTNQDKEQPISTIASIHTQKDDFKYEDIEVKSKLETGEIVEASGGVDKPTN